MITNDTLCGVRSQTGADIAATADDADPPRVLFATGHPAIVVHSGPSNTNPRRVNRGVTSRTLGRRGIRYVASSGERTSVDLDS